MSAGGMTLGYDARGNLTSSGGASHNYTADNLLTLRGSASFTYDPLLRLLQTTSGSEGMVRYGHDGMALASEYNESNALQRRYVYGAGIDEPLVWYHGSGTGDRRFLHADECGLIVAVSNASVTVTTINHYHEYGIPAAGNAGRFQYSGKAWRILQTMDDAIGGRGVPAKSVQIVRTFSALELRPPRRDHCWRVVNHGSARRAALTSGKRKHRLGS